jgi:flagellar hook-associated protein 2
MSDAISTNTTNSGRIFITGQSSGGIDTNQLIEATYEAKLQPAVRLDTRVEENTARAEGYGTLQSLMNDLSSALEDLKAIDETGETNAFDNKTGIISSTGSAASSLVDVAINADAVPGSYNLEVLQTAQSMVVMSNTQADSAAPLGFAGSFEIGLASGSTFPVTVDAGDSLNDIALAINARSSSSGVTASVVEVSPGSYALTLNALDAATDIVINNVVGDDVMQSLGITDALGDFQNISQAARQAQIRLNGVTITRDSNDFSGLINGVTIEVRNAEPGTNIQVTIEEDATQTKEAILAFVDAYNAYREFYDEQSIPPDPSAEEDDPQAVLYANSTLRTLDRELDAILNGSYNENGDAITTLRDMGITLDAGNFLEVDEAVLDEALLSNYDQVRGFFESEVEVTGAPGQTRVLTNNYNGPEVTFTLDVTVDPGTGDITAATVNGDTGLFTFNGKRLIGAENGPYAGMTIAYVGGVDTSLTVRASAGLADKVDQIVSRYADPFEGVIQQELLQINDENASLESEASRIREKADIFLDKEIARYSAMEAAIAEAESLQNFIDIILGGGRDER